MTVTTCPTCAASASGNFCPACGTALAKRTCTACGAELSPGARFCHRCGDPVAGVVRRDQERRAWIVAGSVAAVLLGIIGWSIARGAQPVAAPDMANPGSAGAEGAPAPSGPAPDISQMTPEERFARLFDRVTRAAQAGDSTEVAAFTPMALGAYSQLPAISNDDRFHAAMLHFMSGDFPGALALADTIQQNVPSHLFPSLIRATVAEARSDAAGVTRSYRDFTAHYPAESAAGRQEYTDHQALIDQFKASADSALNVSRKS
jgi:hypothetical protein